MISVWVPGWPRTKGSTRQQGRRTVRADTDAAGRSESAIWAQQVTQVVLATLGAPAWVRGPVFVRLTFWLPVADPTTPGCGDLDKLERNILDALTKANTYGDDVQVTRTECVKYGAQGGEPTGVLVEFEPDSDPGMRTRVNLSLRRYMVMRAQGLT